MKEYDVLIANPAGNITAFVLNQNVEKNDYINVANKLMNIKEFDIEQVGFIKKPIAGGELRLEMMGGEFCGNATRSFGLYIANKKGETSDRTITVEISGCSNTLDVETNVTNDYARTSMPLPKVVDYIKLVNGQLLPAIVFEGIVHVIVEDEEVSNEMYEKVKKEIINKYNPEAFGLMFLKSDKLYITPVVYVRETDSLVYERSCGSGSISTAIYLAKNEKDGVFTYDIYQPGGIIETKVYKEKGKVVKATIGGKVTLSDIKTIQL